MLLDYIIFGISISFISWIVGLILNAMLVKTKYYEHLSHFNFIKSPKVNKWIGMKYFKWIVKNTFFKFFNQKIKLKNQKVDLKEIRKEMTIAEIGHLIGFVFVIPFAIYKSINYNIYFGIIIMFFNVIMNLYPSLLQQENKRRIDKMIRKSVR